MTPAEFECCECLRHIVVLSSATPPEIRLCAACSYLPGWFRVPDLRAAIDPDHDGIGATFEEI